MPDTERHRVLVVDDDLNLRKIICLFLQNADYETEEAKDGAEAIDAVRRTPPDIIILDVMMPRMDGFEVCRKLKADPKFSSIPIIICTARNRKEDIVSAIQTGADDYVVKPFTKQVILGKVERALRSPSARSSTRLPAAERRAAERRAAGWRLSWGKQTEGTHLPPMFKGKVLDISTKGMAFEFNRCDVCTGYEEGTVHPLCLFAGNAARFENTEEVDLILNVNTNEILEVRGRIVHVFQWKEKIVSEKVGISFTRISEDARSVIDDYVSERDKA